MAEKKFFVDINLQGSALTNAKIGTNSGIGSTEGAFGYDSSAHRLQYFDGTATKEVANLSDIAAVTGGLIFQGGYDPTTNTPDIADGSALKGFFWAATAAGTFLGESVQVGDSIVARVDNAGATIADWLILQGNVVIATDEVDGIVRLATQAEADAGTEGGAVVITPRSLQGKIDAQITPEINSKLSKSGDTMSGYLDMGGNTITNIGLVVTNELTSPTVNGIDVYTQLNMSVGNTITNLPAPTNDGDATNKLYVDNASNDKLPLAGGTMSGGINMGGNKIQDVDTIYTENLDAKAGFSEIKVLAPLNADSHAITNLPAPLNTGDAANKAYVDNAASTAQTNAEAYADSLAPNYDAAGAAATAESNANAYTDTEIATEVTDRNNAINAQSYSQTIAPADWQFNTSPAFYYVDITHNLGNFINVSTFAKDQYGNYWPAEFSGEYNPTYPGLYGIYSNVAPTYDVLININKAGGNL